MKILGLNYVLSTIIEFFRIKYKKYKLNIIIVLYNFLQNIIWVNFIILEKKVILTSKEKEK